MSLSSTRIWTVRQSTYALLARAEIGALIRSSIDNQCHNEAIES